MQTPVSFYDSSVWNVILLVVVLYGSLLLAQVLKSKGPLSKSLMPNAVLGGVIILVISTICKIVTGNYLFELDYMSVSGKGLVNLEVITYHSLAIGFIALSLRPAENKKSSSRTWEVIDSGLLCISGYLIQAVIGLIVTIVAALIVKGVAPGSGILLCFGFGQGTGQAMTQGANFDAAAGSGETYLNLGLTLAAFGFLIASLGGVVIINFLRRKNLIKTVEKGTIIIDKAEEEKLVRDELIDNEAVDRMSIQFGLIMLAYLLAFIFMKVLGSVAGGMIGTVYGFNFLFGVLGALIIKKVLAVLVDKGIMKRQYNNSFLLNRISGFAFDLMIVSGIAAIQIHLLTGYVLIIALLVTLGTVATFAYVMFVCKKKFSDYAYEQFMAFFGMLTGTASTGMILLRSVDPGLETKASENLVLENLPAIILALPLLVIVSMLYSSYETVMSVPNAVALLGIVIVYGLILNVVLFRNYLKRPSKNK